MTTLSAVVARVVALALLGVLRISKRRAGLVLVYHGLADVQGDPATELVPAHSTDRFEGHLRHLVARYRIVGLEELPRAVGVRSRGEPFPVAVTFDDDLASHLEVAAPILRRNGALATFFLSGASLAGKHAFWWQRLQVAHSEQAALPVEGRTLHEVAKRIEAMTPAERAEVESQLMVHDVEPGLRSEQVRGLVEAGFDIGFHTLRHHVLTGLDDSSLEHALEEGRRALEDASGRALDTIAYPHGKADDRVARAAAAHGFRMGVTGRYEPVVPESDPMLLGRIEPTYGSDGRFALQVARTLLARHHA
jgi:peptidoglycan/xylan/chitin deacetylase (PgdA/CDA1 family)